MRQASALDSRQAWARMGVALAVGTIGNAGMWASIMVLPAVQFEFGVDRAAAALPYTLTMAGYAIGNLLLGRAVDRWGIAPTLLAAAAGLAAGYVAAGLAGSVPALALVQLAIGIFTAASFGPLIADVSHWFLRRRGIAVAIVASGNYLSGAVWPMLLAGVLAEDGWRAAYRVLAILTLAIMLPGALALRRQLPIEAARHAEADAAQRARSVGLSPKALTLLLGLAGIGCCVAMSMPQVHIVAWCTDLGYGPAVGAQMLSLMLGAGVISRIVFGLLADRLGGVATLLLGAVLQCVALALYLPSGGLVSLYVVSLVFGLSQGGIVPSYALIVREYMPAREAGARVGFVIMATIVGMAAGGWMAGRIHDLTGSYELAILNGVGWNLLTIAVMALLLLRSRRPAAAA